MLRGAPYHSEIVDALSSAVERHPRLRRRRIKRRGRLAADWVEQGFDLSYHLRWERVGNDRDLLGIAAHRFFQPLAQKAPPWELHVLEGDTRSLVLVKGDPPLERSGLCAALLASLVDEGDEQADDAPGGVANPLLALVETLEGLVPRAAALRQSALSLLRTARETAALSSELARATLSATRRDAEAWSAELAAAALRAARSLGALVTERLAESAPGVLAGAASTPRALALVDLPLAALEAVRRPLGLALEDVLLSISAGALARIERDQRGVLPATLRALVSLPEARVAGMLLPIDETDPLRRAAHFHDLIDALGGEARLAAMKALAGAMTALPLALSQGIARTSPRYDVELAFRDAALHARTLAGARVQRIYPIAAGATGLAVGAQRFDRWLSLGVSFDSSVVGRPRGLVDAWQAACGEFIDAAIHATALRAEATALRAEATALRAEATAQHAETRLRTGARSH